MVCQSYQSLKPSAKKYPALLREIHDPPVPLLIRGELNFGDRLVVAVVGSRKATYYGRAVTQKIIETLARVGTVIVSGLAYGIDGAAHEAALKVQGLTVAVLGTPIDQIYPQAHIGLGKRILDSGGAIVSEVLPGGEVHRGSFPRRNRIIAGLAHATIVIEAALDSGSLITARCALEENREVFTVPGPINSSASEGTNNLLKMGAHPITEANDLLSVFNQPLIQNKGLVKAINLSTEEKYLFDIIPNSSPIHIDNLVENANISLPALQSQLTLLELRGLVRMSAPGYYIKS